MDKKKYILFKCTECGEWFARATRMAHTDGASRRCFMCGGVAIASGNYTEEEINEMRQDEKIAKGQDEFAYIG